MSTRVCEMFPPDKNPPYDMARHMLGPILPDDRMWVVDYSIRNAQFNCATKVASTKTKSADKSPIELGVILRFKITKENELYASELIASREGSSGTISGQTYVKLKTELMKNLAVRWKASLKISGVRADF